MMIGKPQADFKKNCVCSINTFYQHHAVINFGGVCLTSPKTYPAGSCSFSAMFHDMVPQLRMIY